MAFNYKLIGQVKQAAHKLASDFKFIGPVKEETHVSPPVTKFPNINPVYPRVKFGPTDNPSRVVKTDTYKPIPGFNPNYGALQPNTGITSLTYSDPGKEDYSHKDLIPSFGSVSKNTVMGNIPGADKYTLNRLANDFYVGDTRKQFYNSLNKTLSGSGNNLKQLSNNYMPPLSGKPAKFNLSTQNVPTRASYLGDAQKNQNYKNFYNSLRNMASWASDNRISKPTTFETSPDFTGSASPGFIETPVNFAPANPGVGPKDKLKQSIKTQYESTDKPSFISSGKSNIPANAVFLHELEHTNQAISPTHPVLVNPTGYHPFFNPMTEEMEKYIDNTHIANDEIPTVISEIAHQAAAAHEATGKYPKGDFYGVPYETIAREAQRRGHVYGNIPMTELLKRPDAQKWLAQVAKGMKN